MVSSKAFGVKKHLGGASFIVLTALLESCDFSSTPSARL